MEFLERHTITATYLRRNFSKIIKNIQGNIYTITCHGKVVGKLMPYNWTLKSYKLEQWWERFERQEYPC